MKSIIFLQPHFNIYSGGSKFVLEVVNRLNKKKINIIIITASINKQILEPYKDIKIDLIKIPSPKNLLFWIFFPIWQLKINKKIKKYDPKIIVANSFPSNWWAGFYKIYNRKVRYIWYCHEPSPFIYSRAWINSIENKFMRVGAKISSPILKLIDQYLTKKVDHILTNGNFNAKQIEKIYSRKVTEIIYPGVDTKFLRPGTTKDNYILSAGCLAKFKNIDLLIKAFNQIKNKDIKLKIVGTGPAQKELIKLTLKLKNKDKIIFLGDVNEKNLINLYKQAKIFLLCSINEPFGMVLIEAMACGTPVIAINSGGPKEIIINKKTGFLIQPDEKDLTKHLEILLDNDEIIKNFGENARIRALNFDWKKTITQFKNLLDTISKN